MENAMLTSGNILDELLSQDEDSKIRALIELGFSLEKAIKSVYDGAVRFYEGIESYEKLASILIDLEDWNNLKDERSIHFLSGLILNKEYAYTEGVTKIFLNNHNWYLASNTKMGVCVEKLSSKDI